MEQQMTSRAETMRTIDLGYEQMFILDGGRDARVRVLYGATWLTEEGEPGDAFLHADGEVALHGGRTVIEGLEPTRLQIVEPARRSILQQAARWLRQAGRSARRQVERLQLGTATVEPNA
jgi:Protein of unknown function (DUF2917)